MRSPNGDGSGSKVVVLVVVAVAATPEFDRKLMVPFIVAEPVESLLDWPSILSLLKREAIEEREKDGVCMCLCVYNNKE